MVLYEDKRELVTKNKRIELTLYEYRFIYYLIKNKNRNCSYKELIIYIYNIDEENYKLFKSTFLKLMYKVKRKLRNKNLKIEVIHSYGIFIFYVVNDNIKKHIKNMEIKNKIIQLNEDIQKKQEEIKKLEEQIK